MKGIILMLAILAFSSCGPKETIMITSQNLNIMSGSVSLQPQQYLEYSFMVDRYKMNHVKLTGSFQVTSIAQSQNEIEVFVIDDANYSYWVKGLNTSSVVYNSGKVTMANINQPFQYAPITMGEVVVPIKYHLVISNVAYQTAKVVNADIKLYYEEK